MSRIRLKNVMIILNRDGDVETYDRFKDLVRDNASDATKMTKKLWRDYVKAELGNKYQEYRDELEDRKSDHDCKLTLKGYCDACDEPILSFEEWLGAGLYKIISKEDTSGE